MWCAAGECQVVIVEQFLLAEPDIEKKDKVTDNIRRDEPCNSMYQYRPIVKATSTLDKYIYIYVEVLLCKCYHSIVKFNFCLFKYFI